MQPAVWLHGVLLSLCIAMLSVGADSSSSSSSSGSSASGSWGSSAEAGPPPPSSEPNERCPELFNGRESFWIDAIPLVSGLAVIDGTGTNYSSIDGITFVSVNITVNRDIVVFIRNINVRRIRIRHQSLAKEGALNVSIVMEDSSYCANMPLVGFYEIMTNVSVTFLRSTLSFLGGESRGMIGTHTSNPRVSTMYKHVSMLFEQCSIVVVSHAHAEEPISVVTFTARFLRFVTIDFKQCNVLVYYSSTDLTLPDSGSYMLVYLGARIGETQRRNQSDLAVRIRNCNISVRTAFADLALTDPTRDDLSSNHQTYGIVVRLQFPNCTVSLSEVTLVNSTVFVAGSTTARFLVCSASVNSSLIVVRNASFRTIVAGPTGSTGSRLCLLAHFTFPLFSTSIVVSNTSMTLRFLIGSTKAARSSQSGVLGGSRAVGVSVDRLTNTTILFQSTALGVESIEGGAYPTVVNEVVSGLFVSDAGTSYISGCTITVISCAVRLNLTSFCPPRLNRTILISSLLQVPVTTNSAAQTVNTGVVVVVTTFVERTRIDVVDTTLVLVRLPQGCTPQGSWFPFPYTLSVGSGLVALSSLVFGQKQLRPVIDSFGPLFALLDPVWTNVKPQIRDGVEVNIHSSRVDHHGDLFQRIQESWEATPSVEFGIAMLLIFGIEVQSAAIRIEGTKGQEMPFIVSRYTTLNNVSISVVGGSTSAPLMLLDNIGLKNSIGVSTISMSGINDAKLHSRMTLWPLFHQMPWFVFFRNVSFSPSTLVGSNNGNPLALAFDFDNNVFEGGQRIFGPCAASAPFFNSDLNSDPLLDVCTLGVIRVKLDCSYSNGRRLAVKDVGMISDACASVTRLNGCVHPMNLPQPSPSMTESAPKAGNGPVAIAVAKPLGVISLIGALAASLSTVSGALFFGRNVGVIRASQCNSIDDVMRSRVDIFSSPTQLSIAMFPASLDDEGSLVSYGSFVVGGVVGNAVVCLGLVCLAIVAAGLLAWRRNDTMSHRQSSFQSFTQCLAMVRFPGITVSVVSPLLQSTMTLCCNMIDAVRSPAAAAASTGGVVTLAVVVIIGIVGWCAAAIAIVVVPSLFRATAVSASTRDKESTHVVQRALQLLDKYGKRTWRWRNTLITTSEGKTPSRQSFVQHMGLLFEDCNRGKHWWLAVDLSSALILGVTNGIPPATPEACTAIIAVNIVVCLLLAGLVILLRPMDSKLNSHLQLFNALMNILISVLAVSERTVSTAVVLSLVVGAISMVAAVLSAIALLRIIIREPMDSMMRKAATLHHAAHSQCDDAPSTSVDRTKRGALLHCTAVDLTDPPRKAPAHADENPTVQKALETLVSMACKRRSMRVT